MRLPYFTTPPPSPPPSPTQSAILSRVRARRAPGPLLPLDRALLLSPPVADGWYVFRIRLARPPTCSRNQAKSKKQNRNSLLGAIRTRTTLPASLRELAICRVAVLNAAQFEWDEHVPLLRAALAAAGRADAAVEDVVRAVLEAEVSADDDGGAAAVAVPGLDEKEAAVLAYTDAMTRRVRVGEGGFARARAAVGGDGVMVELTATVAAYNMVSRFLVALDVGERGTGAVVDRGCGGVADRDGDRREEGVVDGQRASGGKE